MVEGKESAAFAMPFCAGTVTGVLLSDGPVSGLELPAISVSAALAAVCLSLSAILVSDPSSPASSPLRCCAVFFAGIFCAFSHSLSSGEDFGPGVMTMAANESAAWLKNVIENFPFSNPDCNALASALVTGDRRMLSESGLIIVVATINRGSGQILAGPDIISRGFVYVRENEDLIEEATDVARNSLEKMLGANKKINDWSALKNGLRDDMRKFIYAKTQRSPVILPIFMEV